MKVTAIILTHNRPQLLKRAVESVLSQTYKDIECIVVDDASEESSESYCGNLGIRYIYISPIESKGGNHARNVGIKASRGEYVAFLDDDDYWLPTKIEKQMELIVNKGCGAVYGKMIIEEVTEAGDVVMKENPFPSLDFQGDIRERILYEHPTTTSSLIISRSMLFEVGLFDEKLEYWQEYELLIRIAQKGPIYMVEEPVFVYRMNTNEKARLSNKYYGWRATVKYIHLKHKALYDSLCSNKKLLLMMYIYYDGKERARCCGLKWRYFINAVCFNLLYLFIGRKQ